MLAPGARVVGAPGLESMQRDAVARVDPGRLRVEGDTDRGPFAAVALGSACDIPACIAENRRSHNDRATRAAGSATDVNLGFGVDMDASRRGNALAAVR